MRHWRRVFTCWLLAIAAPARAEMDAAEDARWFPDQAPPKGLVRTIKEEQFPEPCLANRMMAQSIAGLAAKAVNEGRGDELVWVGVGNADIEGWSAGFLGRYPAIEDRGTFGPWELVDRFAKKGVIKGYILYRQDRSPGEINAYRPGMDCSVNIATSLAGLLDGIIIDEGLEAEAKAHGLGLLADARDKTQAWCFRTYKDQFNRRMLCTQDPRKPNIRDLAIAQKALTIYGDGEPAAEAMQWLEPLSPIFGWNGGDEFETTRLSSIYGHFQTATDWCMNLPVLMAGSASQPPAKVQALDPRTIDWEDKRSAVSFICTDGDNVQWLEGGFFGNASYWGSPDRGRIPFGWSCCFAHLAQLCPQAIDHALATRTPNDWFVEWGGGYYYPELFATERPDPRKLLARHARRTWEMMRVNNTRIIGFNVAEPDSDAARAAYESFAGETDGLLAILVFKYSPYEGGAGKVYWVKDRRGVEIPVLTARYAIWEHTNERPRSGTPAKIAREIRETVERTPPDELPRYDWAVDHVWSYFRRAPGPDEGAENMPQQDAPEHGGVRGYSPALWCAERLPETIRTVSPEELAWRLRMKHDPEQTEKAIREFRP